MNEVDKKTKKSPKTFDTWMIVYNPTHYGKKSNRNRKNEEVSFKENQEEA